MIKAAGLGLLGQIKEGKEAVGPLLALKPDFPSRGRILIGHYIKFQEIVPRVLEGLNNVGLSLD